jgi:hypothetical protein
MSTVFNTWSLTTTSGLTVNKANWVLSNGVMTTKSYAPLGTIRVNSLRGRDDIFSEIFSYPNDTSGFNFSSPVKISNPVSDSKYIYVPVNNRIDAYDKSFNLVWSTLTTSPYLYNDSLILANNYLIADINSYGTPPKADIYNKSNGTLFKSIPGRFLAVVDKYILSYINDASTSYLNIVSLYDFNGNMVTTNINLDPNLFIQNYNAQFADGGKTLMNYNYQTKKITSYNLLDGTERWSRAIPAIDNNAYFKLLQDKNNGNSMLIYPTAIDYQEAATMRIAVISNTGQLLADNVMQLSQYFGYGTFNRNFWRYGLNMYYENGRIHSHWNAFGTMCYNIYDIYGNPNQINTNYSSYLLGPGITISADGSTLERYEQIDGNYNTQYYKYIVNDPSGNFKYSFTMDKNHPYVVPVGDQKLIFFDSGNYTPIIILDTSTLPLPYPKQFTIGEDYNDIWIGGNTFSIELVSLTLTPAKISDEGIGLAFRAQNSINYLSAEFESGKLRFKKTVNGISSTINEIAFNIVNGNKYRIKVIPSGSTFAIYVNDIFQLSGSDSSWGSGKLGIIDRGQQSVSFSSISSELASGASGTISGVALINSPITYAVTFTDPENDPRLTQYESWTYTHNPSVFMNPTGTWGSSGSSFATAQTSFPLPGDYSFTFKSKDDPNSSYPYPSMTFNPYRQWSNSLNGKIRVHRIPFSLYTLGFNGNNTVNWMDTSYDPDRFNPSNNSFSTEPTGINYQTTRGVLGRQYYYVTPSGTTVNSQLYKPAEYGTYTVGMAVKDEYDAWSEWNEQTIFVSSPMTNTLPVANIIDPTSTTSSTPTIYATLTPLYKWTYSDADGDPQKRFTLYVNDSSNNIVSTSNEVLSSALQWQQPTNLAQNVVYSVQVMLNDGTGYSNLSAKKYFKIVINTPPTAVIIDPVSSLAASPTIYSTLKPLYKWTYSDADGNPQQRFTLNVYNSSNAVVYTSGDILSSAASWQQPTNLSANVVYSVQVMVHDGIVYGGLSAKRYFKLNQPPTGNLTFLTPIYQNDSPSFTITQSDPDLDALTINVDSSFNGGAYTNIKNWSAVPSGVSKIFSYGPLAQGTYTLRLTLDDLKGGTYTQTYNFTALPLTISGSVTHTVDWESYRQQWNTAGRPPTHNSNDFWAGEALELSAVITNTGTSSTKPSSVKATLIQTTDSAAMTSSDQINYKGEIANAAFIHSLSDGVYTMRFQVTWNNGLVQTTDVPFNIKGNINDVMVTQLRN